MSVSVRERPGGYWQVDVNWRGERVRKLVSSEKVARIVQVKVQEILALADLSGRDCTIQEALAAALPAPPKRPPTVGDYAKRWKEINAGRDGWKRSTRQNYESILDNHILPEWKETPLDEITRTDVRSWLMGKSLAPKTVRNIYRALSSLVSAAVDDDHLPTNPILRMGRVLPKVEAERPKPKAWSSDELHDLLEKAREHDSDHYDLYLVLAKTGARIGEAIAIRWQDVDFKAGGLTIDRNWVRGRLTSTKGRQYRTLSLSIGMAPGHPPLREILRARRKRASSLWVFPNATGEQPLDPDNLRRRNWYPLMKRVEAPDHGFHGFRHTFASHMLLRGEPMWRVSRMLGHKSVKTTADIYGHVVPIRDEAAEEAEDG